MIVAGLRVGDEGRLVLAERRVVDAGDDERDLRVGVEALAEVDGRVVLFGGQPSVAEVRFIVRGQENEVQTLERGRRQRVNDLGLAAELAELAVLLLDVGIEELERGEGEFLGREDAEDLLALERVGADDSETGLAGLGRSHECPYRVRR